MLQRKGRIMTDQTYAPARRGCAHHYPSMIIVTGARRRARCLNCGTLGAARADLRGAMRALRGEPR